MSGPVPSPSMNGTTGADGTSSAPSSATRIGSPSLGGASRDRLPIRGEPSTTPTPRDARGIWRGGTVGLQPTAPYSLTRAPARTYAPPALDGGLHALSLGGFGCRVPRAAAS